MKNMNTGVNRPFSGLVHRILCVNALGYNFRGFRLDGEQGGGLGESLIVQGKWSLARDILGRLIF